jgi:dihydroorotate dehydrogenase (fumarate)
MDIEAEYYKIVKSVSEGMKIPVAVKIADSFTNLGNFVSGLQGHGAKGAVLFNRFYTPDISLKSLKIVPATPFSCKAEYLKELRWIALLSPAMRNFSLSASTGVYDSSSAIKLLLAGADTVQLCSVLYKQGPFVVQDFNRELKEFMKSKGFKKISDFKGMLNYANISNPQAFERVQFLKTAEQYSKEMK